MTTAHRRVLPFALAGLLTAGSGGAMLCLGDPLTSYDADSQAWLSQATLDSGKAYLGVRGLNAVVSVVKGSEVELAPAGFGVSLAAGEVLDPLDDMTERVADVLVLSTATVGVYRLLQPMVVVASSFGLQLALIGLGVGLGLRGAMRWRGLVRVQRVASMTS